MIQSIFNELNQKELELVRAGEASIHATIQEMSESGNGYAVKCCNNNGTESPKPDTPNKPEP